MVGTTTDRADRLCKFRELDNRGLCHSFQFLFIIILELFFGYIDSFLLLGSLLVS
jgi:hypothetical protein